MKHTDGTTSVRATEGEPEVKLFEQIETNLYAAVISDSLDELDFPNQAMKEYLRPLHGECCFAGRARTIAWSDVYHDVEDPYALEIKAVDSILPGEVVVVSTQQSKRNAPWGELISTASKARRARGAVIDGLVRDVKKIEALDFPIFAAGIKPVDSKGRGIVIDYNVPVECGGVIVHPGDILFADYDGVVVIPSNVAKKVIRLATEKAHLENRARAELLKGAYLRDVYDKYGVL